MEQQLVGGNPESTKCHDQVDMVVLGHRSTSGVFFHLNWSCEIKFQHLLYMLIPVIPDWRQWLCGIGVQDGTLPKRTHPSSSPFLSWEGKTSNNSSASPWVQSMCWAHFYFFFLQNMQYFFCFLLENCESASSLSCPCRLTDRKCVFLHILAFPSWVLHHLNIWFFFFTPTAVTTFYFRLSQIF